MRILVTGSKGFLGTHLVQRLKELGHSILAPSSKEADLCLDSALTAFTNEKFDHIFHLAAWTQAGDFCLHHPGEQWIINQKINTNVLSWWKTNQPQAKLIAIGSSCCYEPGRPHLENNFLEGQPIESLYTYAMTKRMLYTGIRALNKQFGLRYLFLVPSTLYGPDYHLDGRQMHFIFDLMRKIHEGKRCAREVSLWGDGSQRRELIHVKDFVDAAVKLAKSTDNEIVNIGGGEEFPIRYFAEVLCEIIGYPPEKIVYDTNKYVGAKSKMLIVEKLKVLLPEFQNTNLREGLADTYKWFQSKHVNSA